MTAHLNCTRGARQQSDDGHMPYSDVAHGNLELAPQDAPDAARNDGVGPSAGANVCAVYASMVSALDRLARFLEQQDRAIHDLRDQLDTKNRELYGVLETLAAKDLDVSQSRERLAVQDQELAAARSRVTELEEELASLDSGSEVGTVVGTPATRIRARAAGFHDGSFFELELGGDRDLYTAQRGIHVTILRQGADGKLSKRHDVFDTWWSYDESKRLGFLLEMLNILAYDTASAVIGVVVAAADEATRNLRNEERTAIANKLGSSRIWDLKWRGSFLEDAMFKSPAWQMPEEDLDDVSTVFTVTSYLVALMELDNYSLRNQLDAKNRELAAMRKKIDELEGNVGESAA
ncbi:hypothetical protein AMAG_08938 [Allomyces macrogynus ATCC 38327]|uniref:ILEI/PANDER domain-containing protein n=1 Tax=Allomyces macrogynus (strain ATCC 38327) TaxID=578462 RepID=A0A0L0SNA0_ALLM3|nr:hypothetical protein AMAG_08938 [Allomyces macrogynus ATCC 38327]|eukprot:KNE63875.1 hypothetical protein AMAG_08938 [Allomyces macrogynus ATCC 38327]